MPPSILAGVVHVRLVAAVLLAGGGAAWAVYATAFGYDDYPLAWRDLTRQAGRLEFPRATGRVYRNRAALAKYLGAVMPGRAPAPPAIDFTRHEALLVALGPRSSTGYDLRIVRVTERRRSIVVSAHERAPALGEPVAARLTYPFRLLEIPRTADKRVFVELEGRP